MNGRFTLRQPYVDGNPCRHLFVCYATHLAFGIMAPMHRLSSQCPDLSRPGPQVGGENRKLFVYELWRHTWFVATLSMHACAMRILIRGSLPSAFFAALSTDPYLIIRFGGDYQIITDKACVNFRCSPRSSCVLWKADVLRPLV